MTASLPQRPLGRTGLSVPALGFGTVKLGRNAAVKYPHGYELPDEETAARILHRALDLGLTLLDTAPAYGLSEERIGRHLAARRREFVLVTKVGEEFDPQAGRSHHDFSPAAVLRSVERSVARLGGPVDVLLVHADDADVERAGDARLVDALERAKAQGLTKAIGFSGKTREGASPGNAAAMSWADVLMVEYHQQASAIASLLEECALRRIGVLAKKILGAGRFPPEEAIRFALGHPAIDCAVVGGLNLTHLEANANVARAARRAEPPPS